MLAYCYVSIMLVLKSRFFTSIMLVMFNWVISMSTIQFNLRVPKELKGKIDKASAESGRSINAEAVYRMEQSFVQEEEPVPMNVLFDDDWLNESGLSKEEFGTFVKMAVQSGVSQYKVDNKDD